MTQQPEKTGKVLIFSAPSGSGKSTLIAYLMKQGLNLSFSVSATSRPPRGQERDGVDYFFLSPEEFRRRAAQGDFIEYEEVYHDRYYGTLREVVEGLLKEGKNVVFDIDVKGAQNVKRLYGSQALSVFIQPPSIEALRERLLQRGTDTPDAIATRLAKAEEEMGYAPCFDTIVVNDNLQDAEKEALRVVKTFLQDAPCGR